MDSILKEGQSKIKIGKILSSLEGVSDPNLNITLIVTVEELVHDGKNTEIKILQLLQKKIGEKIKELQK